MVLLRIWKIILHPESRRYAFKKTKTSSFVFDRIIADGFISLSSVDGFELFNFFVFLLMAV